MQQVSDLYNQIISEENHWFELALAIGENGVLITERSERLLFGNTSILVDSGGAATAYRENILKSISTSQAVFSEDHPTVGSAVGGEIDIAMLMPAAEVPRRARLVPFVRAANATNTSEWLQKGVYYVDTRERTKNSYGEDILTMHGYDSMLLFETNYPSDTAHNYPLLDTTMVSFIAASQNVPVDQRTYDRMTKHYAIPLPVGYTCRETLGIIAACYGGNFVISDEGALLLIRLCDLPKETSYLITHTGDVIVFGDTRVLV